MADMLVKLYDIEFTDKKENLIKKGITIKKASVINRTEILNFVKEYFDSISWVNECEYALFNNPISCYIAVKDKEIIGFSCYDATAKGFFGPMGVKNTCRGQGVGAELLMKALGSMKEAGYGYAIMGWVAPNAINFYKKTAKAVMIEDSPPEKSVYKNLITQQ